MSLFPGTYTEYSVPDRGRGIYKKITSQYPARSPWGQKNRFFSAYQGIYRKFVAPDPLFSHQRGTDAQFFCIYPASPYKLRKKGRTCEAAGYCGTIILYIPCRILTASISEFICGQSGAGECRHALRGCVSRNVAGEMRKSHEEESRPSVDMRVVLCPAGFWTIVTYSPAHLIHTPCALHFLYCASLSTHAPADGSCPNPAALSLGRAVAACRSQASIF